MYFKRSLALLLAAVVGAPGAAGTEQQDAAPGARSSLVVLQLAANRDGDSSSGLPCAASTAARRAAWSVDGLGLWFRPGMNEVATPILGSSLGRGRRDAGND